LKVNNNGLGPEGGRLIGEALEGNEGKKLEVFEACRNRLENEGAIAISKAFA